MNHDKLYNFLLYSIYKSFLHIWIAGKSFHKSPGFDKKEKQMMVPPHETVDGIHITGMNILLSNPICVYYNFTFHI